MGLIITDGRSGKTAGVSGNNRLNVSSRSAARAYYNARFDGQAYAWAALTYDYDIDDTILLVKNTSSSLQLHIHAIWLGGNVAGKVIIHRPTTVVATPAGTAVVGTNLNGSSNNVADAVAKADETTNALGDTIFSVRMPADDTLEIHTDDIITLAQNQSLAVDFGVEGAACQATIWGYFETLDA